MELRLHLFNASYDIDGLPKDMYHAQKYSLKNNIWNDGNERLWN